MTTSTKARPKPAAPKPQAPKADASPSPKVPANVPETDAAPKATNSPPANYAAESVRNQVTEAMAKLRAQGFTRPSISAVTGLSDSQVWRAQNGRVHTAEVPVIMDFVKQVVDGKVQPPANGVRKPKAADLQAKLDAAIDKIANSEAKTAAQYKALVADLQATLEA